jgi:hypothetical protein
MKGVPGMCVVTAEAETVAGAGGGVAQRRGGQMRLKDMGVS